LSCFDCFIAAAAKQTNRLRYQTDAEVIFPALEQLAHQFSVGYNGVRADDKILLLLEVKR